MAARKKRVVNLALQGGGAHGAFTWGALDRLMDEKDIEIDGVTATSAGAMNAAAIKIGWHENGRAGVRRRLDQFWLSLSTTGDALPAPIENWLMTVAPSPGFVSDILEMSPVYWGSEMLTRFLSPYEYNPFNIQPFRKLVETHLDEESLRAKDGPQLFINATNVRTGKAKVFSGDDVTIDALMASACLPTIYQAVEIEDKKTGQMEAYWDGGYTGNPSLFPLYETTKADDILIIHINPLYREQVPHTATEISNRVNEISFNASLLKDLRAVAFVNRLTSQGNIPKGAMRDLRIHSVMDDETMRQLGVATKMTPDLAFLLHLKEAGRRAMSGFLRQNGDKIGKESSVNLTEMYS
ncbi:patatin-like phospholipase family protein [Paracoccaceae bacterium GXU_MW_L88]